MEKLLEIFNNIHPLSTSFVQSLENQHHYVAAPKSQLYLSTGQICHKAGFLIEGAAAAFLNNDVNQVVDFWQKYDFILPGYSLYTGIPSEEGIVFLENSKIIQFRRSLILELKRSFAEAQFIFNHFDGISENRSKDRALMLTMKAKERLENYEKRFPKIPSLINRGQEAFYLGIAPSTRSRI